MIRKPKLRILRVTNTNHPGTRHDAYLLKLPRNSVLYSPDIETLRLFDLNI